MTNHQRTGSIIAKERRKVYDKTSPYHGNQCYKLTILREPSQSEEYLFAYPNLVAEEIMQTIQQSHYIDQRYLFFCQKKANRLILTDWRPLPAKLAYLPPNLTKNNQLKDYD